MLDSQQKRKIKQIMYHRATIVALFVVLLVILHSTWVTYEKKQESEELKDISLRYRDELYERNRKLELQMENLKTESGKEAEIRAKFGVAKDNENIAVIVEGETTMQATSSPKNLWQKLIDLFKK